MKKKLSRDAYGGIEGSKYDPYVSKGSGLKEITPAVIIVGIILAIIFSASNMYAGAIAGLTVAAGIPGAILGSGMLGAFSKKSNVLNTNIVQGMSSGGESIASGLIFVMPAVFLIGSEVSFFTGVLVGVTGSLLGIAITSLVYKYLIIDSHGELIYPEAMAISETLVSSDAKGEGLKIMGIGAGIATLLTIISTSMTGIFNTTVAFAGERIKWQWMTDANPLLLGIGFIVGMEVAVAMFAGSIMANFVITPLIAYFSEFANTSQVVWNDPTLLISEMSAADIQSSYTKYIGAGMMLAGGFIGVFKLLPVIVSSLKNTFSSNVLDNGGESNNFFIYMLGTGLVLLLATSILISTSVGMIVLSFLLIFVFIFLFAIVASRMTGTIGTSNLPVSGMTIASLLIVTVTFLLLGWTTQVDNVIILLIASTIVTGISASGGYAQSQKATYIIGGTKSGMQKSFTLATIVGVITSIGVLLLLSPQFISGEIQPPQAALMATLTQGILTGNLPWLFIFTGISMAFVFFFLDLPIMTLAIGFYLPMGTVTIILFGALIRFFIKRLNRDDKEQLEGKEQKGIIYSSGLIAGGAITGLIGSAIAIFSTSSGAISDSFIWLGTEEGAMFNTNITAFIVLALLLIITFVFINKKVKINND